MKNPIDPKKELTINAIDLHYTKTSIAIDNNDKSRQESVASAIYFVHLMPRSVIMPNIIEPSGKHGIALIWLKHSFNDSIQLKIIFEQDKLHFLYTDTFFNTVIEKYYIPFHKGFIPLMPPIIEPYLLEFCY